MSLIENASGYALAFQANDTTSSAMQKAIAEWFDLYYRCTPTKEYDPCQRIPYTIVRKLTKTVFSEYTANSKDEFADKILKAIGAKASDAMQMALIGGECGLKPMPAKDGFNFVVVPRNNILVFARDAEGSMTDIGTAEISTSGNRYYTLLERRTVDASGYLTIRNRLFQSYTKGTIGQEVPLSTLPKYADLQEEYTFTKPVGSVGLISLRTPMTNCVDGTSDAVSVYAAAAGLIRNIDRNEAQINGEFERGESRIIVSSDLLGKDKDGNKKLQDHIFVGLDEDAETTGITTFSPTLREASFLARKQEYLRNVENVIGLKRGLLSEVEAAERTATEITSSAGEYNLTIIDFQRMWEEMIAEAMRLCGILGQLYRLPGAHEVQEDAVVFNWGNGVLYDEAKTNAELLSQVQSGLLQPERYMGWYHNLPCETQAERDKIRKDYMPVVVEEGAE